MNLSPRKSRAILIASTLLFLAFLGVTFGRPAPLLALRYPLLVDLTTGLLFSLLLYAILHANPAPAAYQRAAHFIAAPTYTLYANHLPMLVFLLACIGAQRAPTPAHCLELAGWFIVCWLYAYGLFLLFESRTPTIRRWIEARLFS
jgi:peptidoglycan/LPS O-acetylase OafA/YrhL